MSKRLTQLRAYTQSKPMQRLLLAVDPGREKSGVAIMTYDEAALVEKAIYPTAELETHLLAVSSQYAAQLVELICGNGTNHKHVFHIIETLGNKLGIPAYLAEEAHTTELARKRYFEFHPPKGLKRLIPKGMLYPPVPVDDFTAWIIGEQYIFNLHKHA